MGINGVLLGTLISSLGYVLWVEVFYILSMGLRYVCIYKVVFKILLLLV